MFASFRKIISFLLMLFLLFNSSLTAKAAATIDSKNPQKKIKHIYIEEGVENVILICDEYDFHKEFNDFQDYRKKYFLLWTGIVAALVIYAYSR